MKSNFGAKDLVKGTISAEVRNVVFSDLGEEPANAATGSLMAAQGYKPDRWKAYMEFDICHSLPAILGPVAEGFWCAYFPQTLAASYASLVHQQMNLNHLLKAYSSKGEEIARDRIVGCVVATLFPREPLGGWKIGTDPETAPCIRACAVIHKLAEGVNRVVGDHQASRKTQSISIEAITSLDNIGIHIPSRGAEHCIPLLACTEEAILDVLEVSPLSIGKINGEQPVFIYGLSGRAIDLRGVGITPRPAEAEAKIISFAANKPVEMEGGTMIAMAASKVDQEIIGHEIKFGTGRIGKIEKVHNSGVAKLAGTSLKMAASEAEPVLEIVLPGKQHVLRRLSEVKERICGS